MVIVGRWSDQKLGVDVSWPCSVFSQLQGTPSYLPPEIICGRPHSPAADAWCLGVPSLPDFSLHWKVLTLRTLHSE